MHRNGSKVFGLSVALTGAMVLALFLGGVAAVQGQSSTVTATHIQIPPIEGKTLSSDGADIDQVDHRLYVTDRTVGNGGLDVFDVSQPPAVFLGMIPLPQRSSGVV